MVEATTRLQSPALKPMDRISEVLFGLIMVLTYTSTLSVVTADRIQIRTMLVGALGCNLAWGIIDAAMYLMARLHDQGRNILMLRAAREAPDPKAARDAIADAMPPLLASALPREQLEVMRQKLRQLPDPPTRPFLTRTDWVGAAAICLIVFLSTLPVAIPFLLIDDARFALRVSNAVAIVMLFLCGYLFGHHAGLRPWATGLCSVAIGSALVVVAIALGG
jgi:VIT1/CCC1 family predicted Fe2+/Mn2+ transporter